MSQFKTLTKYIPLIENDNHGEWVEDMGKDGKYKQMPYIMHTVTTRKFMHEVYAFVKKREDLNLYQYKSILERNGINQGVQNIEEVDITSLDGQCLVAMILTIIRADRFNTGILLGFLKEGYITRLLIRLKKIDNC